MLSHLTAHQIANGEGLHGPICEDLIETANDVLQRSRGSTARFEGFGQQQKNVMVMSMAFKDQFLMCMQILQSLLKRYPGTIYMLLE